MIVVTKPYGTIEVDERQKIHFPSGILGFEDLKNYVLLDAAQEPFYWLQSVDDPEVAFILINPFSFREDYDPAIPPEELSEIEVTGSEELLLFAIVTIPEDRNRMTANLQGPVIINKPKRIARQCISMDNRWKIKHVILEELASAGSGPC